MRRNFDLSTGLVAIGAVAVLISLFLDWFEPGISAWNAFELVDWLLAALCVGALVVIGSEAIAGDARSRQMAWICGIVAFVIIAQLLNPPPAASGTEGREVGAWLALAGAAAMVGGAVLALAEISVSIDVAERRRRMTAFDAREDAEAGAGVGSGSGSGSGGAAAYGAGGSGDSAAYGAGGSGGSGGSAAGGSAAASGAGGYASPGAGAASAAASASAGDAPAASGSSGLWKRPTAPEDETRRVIVPDPPAPDPSPSASDTAPESDEDRTQEFRSSELDDDNPYRPS